MVDIPSTMMMRKQYAKLIIFSVSSIFSFLGMEVIENKMTKSPYTESTMQIFGSLNAMVQALLSFKVDKPFKILIKTSNAT